MPSDDRRFLHRWARRKRESTQTGSGVAQAAQPPPELPAVESLTFESDFKGFMHAKVEERLRRAALNKLFRDPRFNLMDGLDVYIDDYSKADPIPAEMLAQLQHATATLFGLHAEEEKKTSEVSQPEGAERVHGAVERDA